MGMLYGFGDRRTTLPLLKSGGVSSGRPLTQRARSALDRSVPSYVVRSGNRLSGAAIRGDLALLTHSRMRIAAKY